MSDNQDDMEIPSIVPERDEVVSHSADQRQRGGGSQGAAPAAPAAGGVGTGVRLLLTVLVLGMLATGGAGYYFYNQGQAALANLADARSRLTDLESRLSTVGESTEETTLNLQQRIETNFSEIDKLWAARNENRSNIAENRSNIEDQQETLGSLENAVTEHADMINENASLVANMQSEVDSIASNISGLENVGEQLSALESDVAGLQDSLSTLEGDVASRLETVEQDIESINVYRLQLNQTISRIEDDINSLQERLGSP